MALFILNTGLRDQELCQLQWKWEVEVPEIDRRVFVIPGEQTKNGEERVVMLNRIASEVIERQRGKHPARVFTYEGRPVGRVLNTSWKRARARAGLPQLRVHDLRHTFGHRLRAAGVHNEDRKALMGHTNGDITTYYSAPDLLRLQDFVNRVADNQRATILRIQRPEWGQDGGKKDGGKMRDLAKEA